MFRSEGIFDTLASGIVTALLTSYRHLLRKLIICVCATDAWAAIALSAPVIFLSLLSRRKRNSLRPVPHNIFEKLPLLLHLLPQLSFLSVGYLHLIIFPTPRLDHLLHINFEIFYSFSQAVLLSRILLFHFLHFILKFPNLGGTSLAEGSLSLSVLGFSFCGRRIRSGFSAGLRLRR